MAYKLEDFPISTEQSQIEVEGLEPGQYVFELTVTDSAGLVSAPHQVVVTIEAAPPVLPEITSIYPTSGSAGESFSDVVIGGANLFDPTGTSAPPEVIFDGGGITAVVDLSKSSPSALNITLTVEATASLGERRFTVKTPTGEARSPENVVFEVLAPAVESPVIHGIEPTSGEIGTTWQAVISGENLADATAVNFDGSGITAVVRDSSADEVHFDLSIGDNAPEGPQGFSVVTPGGVAQSPAGIMFEVLSAGAEEPAIHSITPNSGVAGTTVHSVIRGVGLSGAEAVIFNDFIAARIDYRASNDTELHVDLEINYSAMGMSVPFSVVLGVGRVVSPEGVSFSVVSGEDPVINRVELDQLPARLPAKINATVTGNNLQDVWEVRVEVRSPLRPWMPDPNIEVIGFKDEPSGGRLFVQLNVRAFPKVVRQLVVVTRQGTATYPLTSGSGGFVPPRDLPVTEVSGIGPRYEERLAEHGINDVSVLTATTPGDLATILGVSESRASTLLDAAKELLG